MSLRTLVSHIDKSRVYEYVDDGQPLRGGTKSVYFSPDKTYVVAFYHDALDAAAQQRLRAIVTEWGPRIFNGEGGAYFKALYAWPTDLVQQGDRMGLVIPVFPEHFYFNESTPNNAVLRDSLKEATLFITAANRNKRSPGRLPEAELGSWLGYFQLCVNLARGVRKLHGLGLAHADLSARNFLVDPASRKALLTDIDELVLPDQLPPDVPAMSGYIAPEVLWTQHLHFANSERILPGVAANLHSLAVLIYGLLLHRHPLKGALTTTHALNAEWRSLGSEALYIEHPQKSENRPDIRNVDPLEMPWASVTKLPVGITGPYLKDLFDRAFISGLHHPVNRPEAAAWETALLRTTDLMMPCSDAGCEQKWYVYDNSMHPRCPFCNTPQAGKIPVLDLYEEMAPGNWKPTGYRIVVHRDKPLSAWHVNSRIVRDEHLTPDQKIPLASFIYQQNEWMLVNLKLESLKDVDAGNLVAHGKNLVLRNGQKVLFSGAGGTTMAVVSMVNT